MMNFDAKHLIRWGIPGWYFLFSVSLFLPLAYPIQVRDYLLRDDIGIVGLAAVFIGLGIVLGNVFTYLSTFIFFIVPNNTNQYIEREFKFDEVIMKYEHGKEIQRLYSYRLGNVHAKRALLVSRFLSLILFVTLCIVNSVINNWVVTVGIVKIVFILVFLYNYFYYNRNLKNFELEILKIYKNIRKGKG